MFKALFSVRLKALWHTMFGRTAASKARSTGAKIGICILMVYAIVTIAGSYGAFMYMLAPVLAAMGAGWLYFAINALVALLLSFIGSVFMARKELFASSDTELLLALPIPPAMAARITPPLPAKTTSSPTSSLKVRKDSWTTLAPT